MKRNNKKGFTIVELVIVIAVIAILAAVLIPTFSSVIKKAKVNNDIQLVRNLNTALATANKKHKTMQSALDSAAKFGYDVAKINASATDNEILWDSVNDVFCYLKDGEIEYIPNSVSGTDSLNANDYRLWKISDTVDPTYSTYYTGDATTFTVENAITKGFDAGTTKGIAAIEYKNTTATPQEVVIRTNSFDTVVTVTAFESGTFGSDDYKSDSIRHFGDAKEVNIIKAGQASYHEFGNVGFTQVASGRFVAEAGSKTNTVVATSADAVIVINGGEIDHKYATDASFGGESNSNGNVELEVINSSEVEQKKQDAIKEVKGTFIVKVGNEKFEELDLQSAFTYAMNNNETVVFNNDIVIAFGTKYYVEVPKDKTLKIDLNGYKVKIYATSNSTSAFIANKGILELYDSKANPQTKSGAGELVFTGTNPDPNGVPGYASNLITNYGHLTINSGYYENQGTGYASYVVDNDAENAQWQSSIDKDVTLTINGGKFRTNKSVTIRMYLDTEGVYNNIIKINNADVGSLWLQDNNGAKAAKGELSIDNSSFLYSVTLGYDGVAEHVKVEIKNTTFNSSFYSKLPNVQTNTIVFKNSIVKNKFEALSTGFLTDGTFNDKPSDSYIANGYKAVDNGKGTWTVVAE